MFALHLLGAHKQRTCPDEKRKSNTMLHAWVLSCIAACIPAIRNCSRLSASDCNHERAPLVTSRSIRDQKGMVRCIFSKYIIFARAFYLHKRICNWNIFTTKIFYVSEKISRIYNEALFINIFAFLFLSYLIYMYIYYFFMPRICNSYTI